MRFWMRRDDLEERLRTRHTARREFVHDLATRLVGPPTRPARTRSARFALVFAVLALLGLAVFGGFGYAASGGHFGILGPVHIVTKAVSPPSKANGAGNGTTPSTAGASQTTSSDTTSSPGNSANTPADDQYKPGCGRGDKNHTHTGPPGHHNGFPGKCPH